MRGRPQVSLKLKGFILDINLRVRKLFVTMVACPLIRLIPDRDMSDTEAALYLHALLG
jgi:hypothetical protein